PHSPTTVKPGKTKPGTTTATTLVSSPPSPTGAPTPYPKLTCSSAASPMTPAPNPPPPKTPYSKVSSNGWLPAAPPATPSSSSACQSTSTYRVSPAWSVAKPAAARHGSWAAPTRSPPGAVTPPSRSITQGCPTTTTSSSPAPTPTTPRPRLRFCGESTSPIPGSRGWLSVRPGTPVNPCGFSTG